MVGEVAILAAGFFLPAALHSAFLVLALVPPVWPREAYLI